MKVVRLEEVKKVPVEMEGAKHVVKQMPISSADGAPTFSFRVFTVGPGGQTPYHTHEAEHVNYVIAGVGVLVDENEEEIPIGKGQFALVLPHEKHCYRNASDTEDLVLLCAVPLQWE